MNSTFVNVLIALKIIKIALIRELKSDSHINVDTVIKHLYVSYMYTSFS